jgi:hypothetical protein
MMAEGVAGQVDPVGTQRRQLTGAGSLEKKTHPIDGLIHDGASHQVKFTAPQREGPYRIFVTIFDGHNHAAYANLPFFVAEE